MRDAAGAAQTAGNNAANTGAGYNAQASTIGAQLTPFLSRQLQNPAGESQQDIGAQLTAGLAGAGGATAGLKGAASKDAATSRDPMGFSAALDAAARDRDKAGAGISEGIAAKNVGVKLDQQSEAAKGLQGLYGMNVQGGNQATSQIAPDIKAQMDASKYGWMQQIPEVTNDIGSIMKLL